MSEFMQGLLLGAGLAWLVFVAGSWAYIYFGTRRLCLHKRRSWKGEVVVRYDSRGEQTETALVYICCDCKKEVLA